jgi:hypothetical protein
LTETGGEQRREVDVLLHVVLVGGDLAALARGADPHAVELRDLFLKGHRVHEGGDANRDRDVGVVPDGGRFALLGGGHNARRFVGGGNGRDG